MIKNEVGENIKGVQSKSLIKIMGKDATPILQI
jgi:hypothetical protein